MSHSEWLYLNVCQGKLGTVIIQSVHILQHDSAETGSLPVGDFGIHNPIYPINPFPAVLINSTSPQIHTLLFLLTNIEYNALIKILGMF
jgi:hypothetical protein